jgi:hypothetical protein
VADNAPGTGLVVCDVILRRTHDGISGQKGSFCEVAVVECEQHIWQVEISTQERICAVSFR